MTARVSFEGLHVEHATDLHGFTGSAVFDTPPPDALYRYLLIRRLPLKTAPMLTLIGANPSVAGAATNDRTVTKLLGFAGRAGAGGFELLNVDALISTDPKGLTRHPDPVGPQNDEFLVSFAEHAHRVVVMWGAIPQIADRAREVTTALALAGVPLWCWGTTKDGHPRHPGRALPYDTPLVRYLPRTLPGEPVTTDLGVVLRPCCRCGTYTRPPDAPGRNPVMGGRGLCGPCYSELYRTGGHLAYPARERAREDVLEVWFREHRARVRDGLCTLADAACDMGMTRAALDQVLVRARRAGAAT
jgi:hypothetical protein